MITNDQELIATQERIVKFQDWLRQLRQAARPAEFAAVAGGYRLKLNECKPKRWSICCIHPVCRRSFNWHSPFRNRPETHRAAFNF